MCVWKVLGLILKVMGESALRMLNKVVREDFADKKSTSEQGPENICEATGQSGETSMAGTEMSSEKEKP